MSDGRSFGFYAVAGVIGFGLLGLINEVRKYPMEAESAGKQVRDRLGSSVVNPESDDLAEPSIYRDWPMVQKGYQSLREMNYNDDFDAEGKVRRHPLDRFTKRRKPSGDTFRKRGRRSALKSLFASEWHYFEDCECGGTIEYRDVYYCSECGQDDVEVLIGDVCPECEVEVQSEAKYPIFYCSDCEETFDFGAEARTKGKVRAITGGDVKLRKLRKDKDLKPEDAIERLEISAEDLMFNDWSKQEMMTHGDDDSFEDWLEHEIENHGNITLREWGDDEEKSHQERYGAERMTWEEYADKTGRVQAVYIEGMGTKTKIVNPDDLFGYEEVVTTEPQNYLFLVDTKDRNGFKPTKIIPIKELNLDALVDAQEDAPHNSMQANADTDEFNAAVYRGRKPVSELGYAERAVMMDKMIEQARIEQSLLELEAAIKMGLITEDEIMKQLSEKFGSE